MWWFYRSLFCWVGLTTHKHKCRHYTPIRTIKVSVYLNLHSLSLSISSSVPVSLPPGFSLVDQTTTQKHLWVLLMGADYPLKLHLAACLPPIPNTDSSRQVATEQNMQRRQPPGALHQSAETKQIISKNHSNVEWSATNIYDDTVVNQWITYTRSELNWHTFLTFNAKTIWFISNWKD